jgi:tetratricopeptide (TPR) repeat protein
MIQTHAFVLVCLFLASAPAVAADVGSADWITATLVQPSFRTTPTPQESERARKDLQAGLDFLRDGRPKEAVDAFMDSVRLAPSAENFEALGTALGQAGMRLKAVWAYGESLRLKADPQVQALLDSLKQKESADDEARYRLLMARAPGEAQAGDLDQAIRDYRDAYVLEPGLESAEPCLRLSADAVEGYLSRGELAKAVEALWWVDAMRRTSTGLGADASDALARLDKAEARAVAWTGMSLRDNRKSMLTDREAWFRSMRARASVGEPGR